MTLTDAKSLRSGEKVKWKRNSEVAIEVCGLHEHMPWCGGNTIIYVRCKMSDGSMRKFSHKELIKVL